MAETKRIWAYPVWLKLISDCFSLSASAIFFFSFRGVAGYLETVWAIFKTKPAVTVLEGDSSPIEILLLLLHNGVEISSHWITNRHHINSDFVWSLGFSSLGNVTGAACLVGSVAPKKGFPGNIDMPRTEVFWGDDVTVYFVTSDTREAVSSSAKHDQFACVCVCVCVACVRACECACVCVCVCALLLLLLLSCCFFVFFCLFFVSATLLLLIIRSTRRYHIYIIFRVVTGGNDFSSSASQSVNFRPLRRSRLSPPRRRTKNKTRTSD